MSHSLLNSRFLTLIRAESISYVNEQFECPRGIYYSLDKFWNKMQTSISTNLCLAKFVGSVNEFNVQNTWKKKQIIAKNDASRPLLCPIKD